MKAKVLIVDDEQSDLHSMQQILEKEGYAVSTANNGAKAIDFLEQDTFNLVLLDIKMPTLTGYDLLQLFKDRDCHHGKIALVSVVSRTEVAETTDLSQIDGFVQKPIDTATFLATVKKLTT